jgi:hypothetical protein
VDGTLRRVYLYAALQRVCDRWVELGGEPEIPIPFAASVPGRTESLITTTSYGGDSIYYALKSQNSEGSWSGLFNAAF